MKVHTLGIEPAKNVFQLHGFHRDELQINRPIVKARASRIALAANGTYASRHLLDGRSRGQRYPLGNSHIKSLRLSNPFAVYRDEELLLFRSKPMGLHGSVTTAACDALQDWHRKEQSGRWALFGT